MTFRPFLDTQEEVLGECIFGGENGYEIKKFHLGWKVDIPKFPTSQPELNFDAMKCPKSGLKGVLGVEIWRTTHQGIFQFFISSSGKRNQFYQF